MQDSTQHIATRIKSLRMAKAMKQSDLDERASLPATSISKIERAQREATASELVRIAKALGVTLDALAVGSDAFVYQEEIKIIEALREIDFEDYKRILGTLEARVYFAAKDSEMPRKEYLEELVPSLSSMTAADRRPRGRFSDIKRVK